MLEADLRLAHLCRQVRWRQHALRLLREVRLRSRVQTVARLAVGLPLLRVLVSVQRILEVEERLRTAAFFDVVCARALVLPLQAAEMLLAQPLLPLLRLVPQLQLHLVLPDAHDGGLVGLTDLQRHSGGL